MNRLKTFRGEETQNAFIARAGLDMHDKQYSLLENGRMNPTRETLRRISEAMSRSPVEIFGDEIDGMAEQRAYEQRHAPPAQTAMRIRRGNPRLTCRVSEASRAQFLDDLRVLGYRDLRDWLEQQMHDMHGLRMAQEHAMEDLSIRAREAG